MKKKKPSLLERARMFVPTPRPTWLDRISPQLRKQVDEMIEAKRSGEITLSYTQMAKLIHADITESGGLPPRTNTIRHTFYDALGKENEKTSG